MYEFVLHIFEYRKSRNLTLEELAALSGVSRSHIHDIEKGKASPTIETIRKLAIALDVHPAHLFTILD